MNRKCNKSGFYFSTLMVLILVLSWVGSVGASVANPYPDLIGTWISTGKVAPAVKFTIGNNLLKTMNPGGENPQYFYNGKILCSALNGGNYTVTKFDDTHYIMLGRDVVQDVVYPLVNISVSDASGKMVYVRAELKNKRLVGKVSIGLYPKMTYSTPSGSDDVFVKQK